MDKPNYTQISNDFLDNYLSVVSCAATKVFLAISRRTIGYHRDSYPISQGELQRLTGLSLNGAKKAVIELEEKQLIKSWKKGSGKNTQTFYELDFESSMSQNDIEPDSNVSLSDTKKGSNVSLSDTFYKSKENLKEKEKESSPPSSMSQNDIKAKIELREAVKAWNQKAQETGAIPDYRFTLTNLPNLGEVTQTISNYTRAEYQEALENYVCIMSNLDDYKPFPIYAKGFQGFIRGGVDEYRNAARPYLRCSRNGKEILPGPKETITERLKKLKCI